MIWGGLWIGLAGMREGQPVGTMDETQPRLDDAIPAEIHRTLCIVVCGAGPASDVGKLVRLAQQRGWAVQIVATPAALPFRDTVELKALTGSAVRREQRSPRGGRCRQRPAVRGAPAPHPPT